MILSFLYIIALLYFLFNLVLIFTWLRFREVGKDYTFPQTTRISVIIPVRNEAENILNLLEDLNDQTYPFENFEVIVANDSSTDSTAELVKDFQKKAHFKLILNNLSADKSLSPKKRAITESLKIATGELIMTTDGDCRSGKNWILAVQQYFLEKQAKLISSPVTFHSRKGLWSNLQIIEFSSLIGSGACAMFMKKPNMCNGANLAYTREAFFEVGGFSGFEHLASGDDEFLMHKIAGQFPEKVFFLKNQDAIVETNAQETLHDFYNQRKRWASKWKFYERMNVKALAIFVFLANFCWILTVPGLISGSLSLSDFISLTVIKFSAEMIILSLFLSFLRKSALIWLVPVVQVIYPFYVSFFGLLAQGKGYEWKGRKLQ